jgi:hypothetical protein
MTVNKCPPPQLFTAVLFKRNADELQEPLLEKKAVTEIPAALPNEKDETSPLTSKHIMRRLKVLSFVTGCMVACASQLFLSQTLWDSDILEQPAKDVVVFSLLWSFWTCAAVFIVMVALIYGVYKFLKVKKDDKLWDDAIFQMESHLIVYVSSLEFSGFFLLFSYFRIFCLSHILNILILLETVAR